MSTSIRFSLAAMTLLIGLATSNVGHSATAWISDRLRVEVRSGPSTSHRILNFLPSGTELTILDRDADGDFVQIRTTRGTEGWMKSEYLVSEPVARDRLVAANRRINELTQANEQQRARLAALNQDKSAVDSSNSSLERQVAALEQELAEIKRISASALEISEENLELNELNARLRAEVDDLVGNLNTLEDNAQQRWLMIGGGLVLIGLALGYALKARPRRSAWT